MTRDVVLYWSNPDDAPNHPTEYAKYTKRSDFLLELFGNYVKREEDILELGCNIGRNLNALWESGYKNLTGVDINQTALGLMEKTYADLRATIYNTTIEDFLKENETIYDVIFTLAVFEHIPHDWIFQFVSKLSSRIIIVIEDEYGESWKHFPRKYDEVFENLGWKQIFKRVASIEYDLGEQYIARVFEKESNATSS